MKKAEVNNFKEYRPVLHYSVEKGWMNDPNGLIYHNGYYHLFYQFHPEGLTHGPMHWGHARSKDLIEWENLPIALYPDDIGVIFSGSAVADTNNTGEFSKNNNTPIVAVFTHHMDSGQAQSIASSTDDGVTFTKYEGNPVLMSNYGSDFRDPKVFWHDASKKWVMVVVGGKRVIFYGSEDLKSWIYLSEFTSENPNYHGIWECPDLFPLTDENGLEKWILLFSINSIDGEYFGMQYVVGDFDGVSFTAETADNDILLVDKGNDNYAAVTYNGVADRRIMIGWMNGWPYAEKIPASTFRGSMTIPRELSLVRVNNDLCLAQRPVKDLMTYYLQKSVNKMLKGNLDIVTESTPYLIESTFEFKDFCITLYNDSQSFVIGLNTARGVIYADRRGCGQEDLGELFFKEFTCPVKPENGSIDISILVDVTSVEIFACRGTAVITLQCFPDEALNRINIEQDASANIEIFNLLN